MKNKINNNKKDTEVIIVTSAKKLIKKYGLPGLTARNVAKEAGYSVGTIYNVFQNMKELILKINGETLIMMQEEFAKTLANKRKDQSLGRIMAKFYIRFAEEHAPFWNLLFEFKYTRGDKLPKWYEDIVNGNFRMIEEAISPFLPNDSKVVHQASRLIWASIHGIVSLSLGGKLIIGTKETPERLSESLFENYIKGLSK